MGSQKGKEPRPSVKVPKCTLSGKGCGVSKTTVMLAQKQPFIQRVRNSSLVERPCAEMSSGLKRTTETMIRQGSVEEHLCGTKQHRKERLHGRENAGMRRDKGGELQGRISKVSRVKLICPGCKSGPKARTRVEPMDNRWRFRTVV